MKSSEARAFIYPEADDFLYIANSRLGRATETRDYYLQILNTNPADDSAARILISVCTEDLSDYDCSLDAAKKAAKTGLKLKAPELQLDFVEAAMLKDDVDNAGEWLRAADSQISLPPELRIVREFYGVWLSLYQKDQAGAQARFLKWQNSIADLRKQKKDPTWSFKAARAIWSGKNTPVAAFILSMIDAYTNATAALPDSIPTGES